MRIVRPALQELVNAEADLQFEKSFCSTVRAGFMYERVGSCEANRNKRQGFAYENRPWCTRAHVLSRSPTWGVAAFFSYFIVEMGDEISQKLSQCLLAASDSASNPSNIDQTLLQDPEVSRLCCL